MMLIALQNMSVLSSKKSESVKQSLENKSQKDSYIRDLQSAISKKDSLNMRLVMNLKSNLSDVKDSDINIKVEKGDVSIDISVEMLFNTAKFALTEKGKSNFG